MKKTAIHLLCSFGAVVALVAVWTAVAKSMNSEMVAPDPLSVGREFLSVLKNPSFFPSFGGTMKRVVVAFFLSFGCAVLFAIPADRFPYFKSAFSPLVVLMRATPTMSVILLCLIWLKAAKSPVAVTFLVAFPMLYSAVLGVLEKRDRSLDEMARVYGVGKGKVFAGMIFPSVFSALFPQLCTTFSFCIKLTVAGESLAATKLSLGREMYVASVNFETARLLAYTLVAVVAAFLAELIFKAVYRAVGMAVYGYRRKRIDKEIRG